MFIESEGARGYYPDSAALRNGPFASSSEELGYNSERSGFRRTLVRPRRMRNESVVNCVISKSHVHKHLKIKLLQNSLYGRLSRRRYSCAGGERILTADGPLVSEDVQRQGGDLPACSSSWW